MNRIRRLLERLGLRKRRTYSEEVMVDAPWFYWRGDGSAATGTSMTTDIPSGTTAWIGTWPQSMTVEDIIRPDTAPGSYAYASGATLNVMPDTCPTCNHDERSSGSPLARIRATLGLKVKPARCPASEPDVYGGQGSIECSCRDPFHGS